MTKVFLFETVFLFRNVLAWNSSVMVFLVSALTDAICCVPVYRLTQPMPVTSEVVPVQVDYAVRSY